MKLSNVSHTDRTRDFFVISNTVSLNLLGYFKHLELKITALACDVFSRTNIPPTESANVLMSGTISNKNRLHEGLEYVACHRGHWGQKSFNGTIHQCCICFSVFSHALLVSAYELASKKQTVKIF